MLTVALFVMGLATSEATDTAFRLQAMEAESRRRASTTKTVYGGWVEGSGKRSTAECPQGYAVVKCREDSPDRDARKEEHAKKGWAWRDPTKGARVLNGKCVAFDNYQTEYKTRAIATCEQGANMVAMTSYMLDGKVTQTCPEGSVVESCSCYSHWGFHKCHDSHPDIVNNGCTMTAKLAKVYVQALCKISDADVKIQLGGWINGNGEHSKARCPSGYGIESCRGDTSHGISQHKGALVSADGKVCTAEDNWSEKHHTRAVVTCREGLKTVATYTPKWEQGKVFKACPAGTTVVGCTCYSAWGFGRCGGRHPSKSGNGCSLASVGKVKVWAICKEQESCKEIKLNINKLSIRQENVVPTKVHGAEVTGRRCHSDAKTILKGELLADSQFEVSSTYKYEENWEKTFGRKIAAELKVAVTVEVGTDTWPVRGSTEVSASLSDEFSYTDTMGGSESESTTTKTVERTSFASGVSVEIPPFSAMQIVAVYTKYDAEVEWWGVSQCIAEDGSVLASKNVQGTWTGNVISENAVYEVLTLPCEERDVLTSPCTNEG